MDSANQSPSASATKEKRVSRACISCRQRKTRCDLYSHGTPGDPPCTRCFQEHLECTLATSRRGGRRPRKRLDASSGAQPQHPGQDRTPGAGGGMFGLGRRQQTPQHALPPSAPTSQEQQPTSLPHDGLIPSSPGTSSSSRRQSVRMTTTDIDGEFASRDLLNPSDALNLLAQVADLDGDHPGPDARLSSQPADRGDNMDMGQGPLPNAASSAAAFYYPPISDGLLSPADASYLLSHYHEHYHPFFPVADSRVFDGRDIAALAQSEPHLLTSIFTVASKDDPAWHRVHEACAAHMDSLVSRLISRGSTNVGAVEALLILAEWVPQRQQPQRPDKKLHSSSPAIIGRGAEDQGAWMQIGVAIRLAYLQGLEQTGLLQDKALQRSSPDFERRRVAWAACYMSDREVSIRLGKGFWSRGPGPSTVLNAGDFPTLRTQQAGSGDLAQLFLARLEMTQLFSNAHDILYSSTTHREQLFVGGEYVRYIDDFSAVLRKWKLVWGGLSLTPSVKAALILSYEFLRLYINAFAFQATISRAITRARQSPPQSRSAVRPLFSDLAGAPDARFIYESIDAANTLLSTLNDFIDPTSALRYMPLKYYLYIIYAAVFLFKARVAGALAGESGSSARRTINVTIDRLQKSSANPHSLGQRYARSLYLLWRKSADRVASVRNEAAASASATAAGAPAAAPRGQVGGGNGGGGGGGGGSGNGGQRAPAAAADNNNAAAGGAAVAGEQRPAGTELDPLKGFSWRDLDGLGQFIGNDMNFLDNITFTTPMSDSDHGTAGLDTMTDAWQDILWSGNDVIF